jgi:hypothetical protein
MLARVLKGRLVMALQIVETWFSMGVSYDRYWRL